MIGCRGAAFLMVVPLVSGCFSPPRRASMNAGVPTAATASAQGPEEGGEAAMASDGWRRSGSVAPAAVLGQGRRVVVTEFAVELVDYQFQLPTPRQVMFKTPPITPNPIHVALRLVGIARRWSRIDEDAHRAVTAALYCAFLDDLRRRGVEVVSLEQLQASPTYAGLARTDQARSSPLLLLNPLGSDMGVVMHTRTVAAPGLGVVRLGPRRRAEAVARIVAETGADAALAVHLRVGTFREQPALEHRSVVRLTTREGSTTLRARHSLVSERTAVDQAKFRPFIGRIESVEPEVFARELTAMLPRFIAPALSDPGP